jgi:hypothetical protein
MISGEFYKWLLNGNASFNIMLLEVVKILSKSVVLGILEKGVFVSLLKRSSQAPGVLELNFMLISIHV